MPRHISRATTALCLSMLLAANGAMPAFAASPQDALVTATPIKHLVVIFGENESFDRYFGTYPNATNPPGEPAFTALPNTPAINGLTPDLLNNDPNLNSANGAGATNPFRLDRSQAHTSSQNHAYGPRAGGVRRRPHGPVPEEHRRGRRKSRASIPMTENMTSISPARPSSAQPSSAG
jgi:phospholipase C